MAITREPAGPPAQLADLLPGGEFVPWLDRFLPAVLHAG